MYVSRLAPGESLLRAGGRPASATAPRQRALTVTASASPAGDQAKARDETQLQIKAGATA